MTTSTSLRPFTLTLFGGLLATAAAAFNVELLVAADLAFDPERYAAHVADAVPGLGLVTVSPVWTAEGHYDTLVVALDGSGTPSFVRRYGESGRDELGHSLATSHDDAHLVVTGRVDDELWVTKIRSASCATTGLRWWTRRTAW